MKKTLCFDYKKFCIVLFLSVVSTMAWGQNKVVTGVVTDSNNKELLVGVSVTVVGSAIGAVTDIDGNFSLNVPSESSVLKISYLGYQTKEIQVGNKSSIEIELVEDNQMLEEVVVVGYGTQKRKDLTGAVASVGESTLRNIPVTSAAAAITGRMAGVNVVTTEGSPDATINIRIRGGGSISQDNSPLFIVDGFQVNNINDVPPTDIESIDVLKDASSTAIYGAKGANGVILVTTKSGKAGRTTVSFNASVGFSNLYNGTEVLSPYEYVYMQRELDTSDNAGFFSKYGRWEDIDIYKSKQGTDWQAKLFENTGVKQAYNVVLSGGDQSMIYSISYTRDDESYIMKGSKFKRDNLNVKLKKTFSKALTVEFNAKMNNTVIDGASVSSGSKLRHCIKFPPISSLEAIGIDDMGDGFNLENISSLNDPFYNIANEYRKQSKFTNSYNGAINWEIIKGLSFRGEGTYGYLFNRTDQIYLANTGEANQKAGQPVAYRTYWNGQNWQVRGYLTYKARIQKHNFDVMGGAELYNSEEDNMKINSDYFPGDYSAENVLSMWNNGIAEPTYTTINEPSRTQSYFGRINYNYNSLYYLTASIRADGTNVFAPGNKWGYFPSVSGAWRISDEVFMESLKPTLSNLKLRLTYGEAGNARVKPFWRQPYAPLTNTRDLYYQNEKGQSVLRPSNTLRNEKLTWETKVSSNIGLDFGFLNNKINLTADLYKDVTKNLIMQVQLPSIAGYQYQYQNLGQTTNKGLELTLNANILQGKDYWLDFNFNFAVNKNNVDKLYGSETNQMILSGGGVEAGSDNYRVFEGEEVGLMWGYVSDGMYTFDDFIFNSETNRWELDMSKEGAVDCRDVLTRSGEWYGPGHQKLKDLDGDGKIDPDKDRQIIGRALPKNTGGFGLSGGWKGIDFMALFNWSYGNQVFNANKIDYTSYTGSKRYQNMTSDMRLDNRFTILDPTTGRNIYTGPYADPDLVRELNEGKTMWHPLTNNTIATDWAVEDASFLRLGTLTIGYSMPKSVLRILGMSNLRIYGTGSNLLCFTSYSGQDPEVSTNSNAMIQGMDRSAYPKARTFIIGANITF